MPRIIHVDDYSIEVNEQTDFVILFDKLQSIVDIKEIVSLIDSYKKDLNFLKTICLHAYLEYRYYEIDERISIKKNILNKFELYEKSKNSPKIQVQQDQLNFKINNNPSYFDYFDETKYLINEYARYGGSVDEFCESVDITRDFFEKCVREVLNEINCYNGSFEWSLELLEITKKDFLGLLKQILTDEELEHYIGERDYEPYMIIMKIVFHDNKKD